MYFILIGLMFVSIFVQNLCNSSNRILFIVDILIEGFIGELVEKELSESLQMKVVLEPVDVDALNLFM